jgi:outer membrane protein
MVEEYQAKLKIQAESATVTDAINGDRSKVQDMQKELLTLEIMLKNYNKRI